jgi:alkaline phosphatase
MNRRKFFKNGSIISLGVTLLHPFNNVVNTIKYDIKNKKAKNIIIIVSDGMSIGTLNMTDLYLSRKMGTGTNWLQLYKENKINRALINMASASSIVTDSAATSSSWGGGVRINNGGLNVSKNGEEHLPIWQKFKKAGKRRVVLPPYLLRMQHPQVFV